MTVPQLIKESLMPTKPPSVTRPTNAALS